MSRKIRPTATARTTTPPGAWTASYYAVERRDAPADHHTAADDRQPAKAPEIRPATRTKSATTVATTEAAWLWVASSCSYDQIGLLPPQFGPERPGSSPGGVYSSIGGRGGGTS